MIEAAQGDQSAIAIASGAACPRGKRSQEPGARKSYVSQVKREGESRERMPEISEMFALIAKWRLPSVAGG